MSTTLVPLCLAIAGICLRTVGAAEPAPARLDSVTASSPIESVDDTEGLSELAHIPLAAYANELARAADLPRPRMRGVREQQLYAKTVASVVLISTSRGSGAGALVSADGKILTNWHVVRGSDTVAVMFKPAGTSAPMLQRGRVARVDEVADLAVVQVPQVPAGIAPLALGQEAAIGIGADVHAIGHPAGQPWTYTKGIVSQIRPDYRWTSESQVAHSARVIQTQTPINPGNSGGPLLADSGAVVGINSFKLPGSEGLNFAVSVDDIQRFLQGTGNRLASTSRAADTVRTSAACRPGQMNRMVSSRNAANDGQVTGYDTDCDGRVDMHLRTPDDVRLPLELTADRNGDGKNDVRILDLDRDRRWDISYFDIDFDGQWDLVGTHPDGKPVASRYERYADYRKRTVAR